MATAPKLLSPVKAPLPFPPPRSSRKNPLALWHLLSLDAPTVAALWTWSLASANHIRLPLTSIAAMAITVWLLYVADRLLDARLLDARILHTRLLDARILHTRPLPTLHVPNADCLEARHHFHHRHRRAFLTGIVTAAIALAALLPHLPYASIRLYLIEGSALAAYFILIHATRSAHRLPKELAVGLFFAAAAFIPTISRDPALRLPLLAPALCFAALCSLNCLFIYSWEHPAPAYPEAHPEPRPDTNPEAHPATRLALRHLHPIAFGLITAAILLAALDHRAPWSIGAAIALSTTILLLLHHHRHRLHPTVLRAAADLALLTPILFL